MRLILFFFSSLVSFVIIFRRWYGLQIFVHMHFFRRSEFFVVGTVYSPWTLFRLLTWPTKFIPHWCAAAPPPNKFSIFEPETVLDKNGSHFDL